MVIVRLRNDTAINVLEDIKLYIYIINLSDSVLKREFSYEYGGVGVGTD